METTYPIRKLGQLPKSWFEINLKDLTELLKIKLLYEGQGEKLNVNTYSFLTGKPIAEAWTMNYNTFTAEMKAVEFLNDLPNELHVKAFTIAGAEYKVTYRATSVSVGQINQISLLTKDTSDNNLPKIAAVLIHPEGEDWETNYEERCKLFETSLPVGVAYPLCAFFLRIHSDLLKTIPIYLARKARKARRRMRIRKAIGWLISGVGFTRFTRSKKTGQSGITM